MNEETKNQQMPEIDMPTPEQIAAREAQRTAMVAFYKKDLPGLKIEAEYNELQERIEKARFQTWQWRIRFDQMMHPTPPEGQDQGKDILEKMTPEANQAFKAAADVDNTNKGNVVPLTTSVTSETKTEGQE